MFQMSTMLRRVAAACTGTIIIIGSPELVRGQDLEQIIAPDLQRVLDVTDKPVPVVVVMKPVTPLPQTLLGDMTMADRTRLIKSRALQTQLEIREMVNELASQVHINGEAKPVSRFMYFWATNGMMVTATPDVIMQLAEKEGVQKIFLDRRIKMAPDYREEASDGGEYTYGLEKIGVPQLRASHPEITGKGVRVGIIDTGIDANHPELKGKVVAFKDFVGDKKEPYDDNGHGTHVAGTISGTGVSTQIGVAPEVSLIIAKSFTGSGSGSLSGLVRAMEWMADPDGNSNTNDRPRVVSNSWGGGPSSDVKDDPFYQAVMTWVELNIFPSFAAGNSGPGKGTVGSPGCLPPAFAVGATDDSDRAAGFSSRGPSSLVVDGKKVSLTKPDISAPGVKVYSSMPGGGYAQMSGTSMATPHLSGAVALIYQVKPTLTIQQVKDLLQKTSQDLGDHGADNVFGSGRLNVAQLMTNLGIEIY